MTATPAFGTLVKIGIIVGCAGVCLDNSRQLLRHARSPGPAFSRPSGGGAATPEQTLFDSVDVDYRSNRKTFLLLVDSTCAYSTKSLPFYRRLLETRETKGVAGTGVRLVAIATQPRDVLRAYLDTHGVRPDSLISLSADRLPVQRTPTLILVSADGRMERSWVGTLTRDDQEAIMAVLDHGN